MGDESITVATELILGAKKRKKVWFQNYKIFFVDQCTNQGSTLADHIATEVFPPKEEGVER